MTDEGGKINLNGLLDLDKGVGEVGKQFLMLLPNMTDAIANAIIDWIDPDEDAARGRGRKRHYSGMDPPYRCKNGPLDSLEELLLVQGVTPGAALRRRQEPQRHHRRRRGRPATTPRLVGLPDRLQPRTSTSIRTGQPRINVNNTDLAALGTQLDTLGGELGSYIVAFRLYGGKTSTDTTGETADLAAVTDRSAGGPGGRDGQAEEAEITVGPGRHRGDGVGRDGQGAEEDQSTTAR